MVRQAPIKFGLSGLRPVDIRRTRFGAHRQPRLQNGKYLLWFSTSQPPQSCMLANRHGSATRGPCGSQAGRYCRAIRSIGGCCHFSSLQNRTQCAERCRLSTLFAGKLDAKRIDYQKSASASVSIAFVDELGGHARAAAQGMFAGVFQLGRPDFRSWASVRRTDRKERTFCAMDRAAAVSDFRRKLTRGTVYGFDY
jgi:hypothetical protein